LSQKKGGREEVVRQGEETTKTVLENTAAVEQTRLNGGDKASKSRDGNPAGQGGRW